MRPTTLALLCCLVFAARSSGSEPRITDLQAVVQGGQVLASFTLAGAFNHRFLERIESGLPTSILYRFELDRAGKRWWERRGRSNTLELTAHYDAEARTYTLHFRLDDKLIESRMLRDLKALEAAMTRVERLPVFALGAREEGKLLRLKVQAELGTRMILSFIPVAIATDWAESNRLRVPQRP